MSARGGALAALLALGACGGGSTDAADALAEVGGQEVDGQEADGHADLAADAADAGVDLPVADAEDGATTDAGGDTAADTRIRLEAGAQQPMSFFVTSTGTGAMGGDLGGLSGADQRCAMLAELAGATGKTWRAFLSTTEAGATPAVNARSRIGSGPWFNRRGEVVASSATALFQTGIPQGRVLDERGASVPASRRAIMTGSTREGLALSSANCANWTTNDAAADLQYGTADGANNLRFSVGKTSCSVPGLLRASGDGRIYCFAVD